MYIEPKSKKEIPVNDELTIFMEKIFTEADLDTTRKIGFVNSNGDFIPGLMTMGIHTCICGEHSLSYDVEVYDGYYTNSLCYHYLRDHRSEVPAEELEKVRTLKNLYDKKMKSYQGKQLIDLD